MKFELSIEQTNGILQALSEIAYKTSAPLIDTIQRQAQEQLQKEANDKKLAETNLAETKLTKTKAAKTKVDINTDKTIGSDS